MATLSTSTYGPAAPEYIDEAGRTVAESIQSAKDAAAAQMARVEQYVKSLYALKQLQQMAAKSMAAKSGGMVNPLQATKAALQMANQAGIPIDEQISRTLLSSNNIQDTLNRALQNAASIYAQLGAIRAGQTSGGSAGGGGGGGGMKYQRPAAKGERKMMRQGGETEGERFIRERDQRRAREESLENQFAMPTAEQMFGNVVPIPYNDPNAFPAPTGLNPFSNQPGPNFPLYPFSSQLFEAPEGMAQEPSENLYSGGGEGFGGEAFNSELFNPQQTNFSSALNQPSTSQPSSSESSPWMSGLSTAANTLFGMANDYWTGLQDMLIGSVTPESPVNTGVYKPSSENNFSYASNESDMFPVDLGYNQNYEEQPYSFGEE